MITFYKDTLVPPELCRLLYQVVPVQYHVPVRFHTRFPPEMSYRTHGYMGMRNFEQSSGDSYIDIYLTPIYSYGCGKYQTPSTGLWHLLLGICLHEFGHVATQHEVSWWEQAEYEAEPLGRAYRHIEQLADCWKDRIIAGILRDDPRLGQPRRLRGYFGALLTRWNAEVKHVKCGSSYAAYVSEMRCRRTGGQLTTGDVLELLRIPREKRKTAFPLLRKLSTGIGIDYLDGAHRRHKLYTWGDLPLVTERLHVAGFQQGTPHS
jgi:hypothetical protein